MWCPRPQTGGIVFAVSSLEGFARISVEELGLRIDGIAVSQRSDGRWGIMLPARPLLDSERNLIRDGQGKPVYVWTLAFCNPKDAEGHCHVKAGWRAGGRWLRVAG